MKKSFALRILPILLALAAMLSLLPVSGSEVKTISECVDITMAQKNIRGENYIWWNIDQKLMLSNCSINTQDRFGIKLPKDCTVVLEGVNTITAAEAAIACEGNVTFEGDGTLILIASENGILSRSENLKDRVRLMSGSYQIKTGGDCIRSDYAELGIVGGSYELQSTSGRAIQGNVVRLSGGTLNASGAIYAGRTLNLDDVFLTVSAGEPALQCAENAITAREIAIEAGDTSASLQKLDSIADYAGQNAVSVISTDKHLGQSALLGAPYPAYADYLILGGVIVLFAAIITLVLVLRWRKRKRLHAYREANIERMRAEAKMHLKKPAAAADEDEE